MRRSVLRGLFVVLVAPLCLGCVSYGAYQGVQDELERTKAANRHLVDQYNRAVLDAKLAREGQNDTGVDLSVLAEERAKNAALLEELERERADGAKFDPGDIAAIPDAVPTPSGGFSLSANLLFNSGESALKATQLPVLDQVADMLQTKYRGQSVVLEGHTDSDPLNKTQKLYHYNLNLGYQRAYHVFKYLREKHGLPENQFRLETYGSNAPLDESTAATKAGKAQNRRVVFRLAAKRI